MEELRRGQDGVDQRTRHLIPMSGDRELRMITDPYGASPVPFSDFQQRVAATIQDSARYFPESTLLLCLDYRAAEHPVRRRTDFLQDHRPHWQ